MNKTTFQLTLTGLLGAAAIWLEALTIPVILLIMAMIIDYATGLMAAIYRGNAITSYRSVNGIAKKVCCLLLVVVGLILDLLVLYAREAFGMSFPWSFILAALIAVWLTANEVISILENIQDIGVQLPAWLIPIVKNLKGKADSLMPAESNEEDKKQ